MNRVRRQWLSWMTAKDVIHGTTSSPLRRNIAEWVDCVMAEMRGEEQIIKNAWQKTGYKWFPKEGGKIAAAATMRGGDKEIAAVWDGNGEEGLPHYIDSWENAFIV